MPVNAQVQGKPAAKRNSGIDFLRIIAMLMIIVHHLLTHGGLAFAFPQFLPSYEAALLLNAAVSCAVNCYALITGFVMSRTAFKLSRLFMLWFEALFWSVGLSAAMMAAFPGQVSWLDVALGLFPVIQKRYWYFTAYFGLYFFIPALNCLLKRMHTRTLLLTVLAAVGLFSLLPVANPMDLFGLQRGYHILWLAVLYLLGGCLREYSMALKPRPVKWALVYALCALAAWAGRLGVEKLNARGLARNLSPEFLYYYTSPAMLLAAVALVLLFARLKPQGRAARCIAAVSPLTFGVYLIHDHPQVRELLIHNRLLAYSGLPPLGLALAVAGSVAAVFGLCLAMEALRQRLFGALKLERLCVRLDGKARAWIAKWPLPAQRE